MQFIVEYCLECIIKVDEIGLRMTKSNKKLR